MNKKAIVLLSGGIDSALCISMAKEQGYSVSALHLNYGQKTESRELKAFNDICNHFGINERLIVDVSHFKIIGGNSLTDNSIDVSRAELDSSSIPNSYVPFRNGNILAISVSWAETIGATAVFIGANQLDMSGYPDCRLDFFDAFQKAINLGTKPETRIEIKTPIIYFSKKDIVENAVRLKTPIELTWSCYTDTRTACGLCDSCALRLRGFQQAGLEDPIPYSVRPHYPF